MIDLNSRSESVQAVTQRLDAARQHYELTREPARNYLGCSYLGDECERKVQYTYLQRQQFEGQLLRIFDRGRWAEDYVALWLQRAGIALLVSDPMTDGQFAVSFLDGRVRGHADGIIAGSSTTDQLPFPVPALWECKCLGDKSWKDLVKNRLRRSKPHYFAQVQLYLLGLGLERCLFTALNANTMELHHELVEVDTHAQQELLARAARILMYCDAGELVSRPFNATDYRCKYCDWSQRCRKEGV